MIVDLPGTTTADISKRLVRVRDDVGAMALSRVLTLVIVTDDTHVEDSIDVAGLASHQHPCRIVLLAHSNPRGSSRLDAQIRVGGDAGASEVIVLRLYGALNGHGRSVITPLLLADSPIVAWWPRTVPASPAHDPIGAMAQRRITDIAATTPKPRRQLGKLADAYVPGDTDLSWARITLWRGLLAAAVDQGPYEQVLQATVTGAPDSPSASLLAGWLAVRLKCPVTMARTRKGTGIVSVRLERKSGDVDLVRPVDGDVATMNQTGQPERTIPLPHRSDAECLADEMRRLDPDEVYRDALVLGLEKVRQPGSLTGSKAVAEGLAPSPAQAARDLRRIRRKDSSVAGKAMVDAPLPSEVSDTDSIQAATRARLGQKEQP